MQLLLPDRLAAEAVELASKLGLQRLLEGHAAAHSLLDGEEELGVGTDRVEVPRLGEEFEQGEGER